MINSGEIRVGNMLRYGTGKLEDCVTVIVETIGAEGINHKHYESHPDDVGGIENVGYTDKYECDALNGIELTPEVLNKCGFKPVKDGVALLAFEGYVSIVYLFGNLPFCLEIDNSRMPLHGMIYLHQLQNLYFALTGEELEITFEQ